MYIPSMIAKAYLRLKKLNQPNQDKNFYFFNNSFHYYNGKYWEQKLDKDIYNEVINFISEGLISVKDNTSPSLIEKSPKALAAMVSIKKVELNTFLGVEKPHNVHYIPVQNGVIEITCRYDELDLKLLPHSSSFISTYALPYDYHPKSTSPIWNHFMVDTLPPDRVLALQEWFGYQLLPVTLAQKFMIYLGMGANGKSVVCLVQRLMLGDENVSSAPLQCFLAGDRFGLASTRNKLANIVPEIDELKTFPTAKIKSYSVGEPFIVEQKFKDPIQVFPTARLTFATNTLPPFRDKSGALKRRLIIIPFEKQILDESKQDKSFVDPNFWVNSGELSGVFNWALEGLRRLIAQNWQFTISPSLKEVVENYNKELNPVIQFMEDHIEIHPYSKLFSPHLYSRYVEYCRDSGVAPETAISFGRAVSERFKGYVTSSKNAQTVGGKRGRFFYGLRLIESSNARDLDGENDALREHQKLIESHPRAQLTQITHLNSTNLISEAKSAMTLKGSAGVVFESDILMPKKEK